MTRDPRPKLQNIPWDPEEGRRIRAAFLGPQGTTMHSETSLEIRIFAEQLVRNIKERNSR